MENTESQTARIEKYLLAGNKLTALSAFKKFGTLRISARIKEIRERHNVKTETVKKKKKTIWQYSITICLMFCILLSGCNGEKGKAIPAGEDMYHDIYQVTIDSCEYIVYRGYQKGGLTHKGNCKNHRKEYENKVN